MSELRRPGRDSAAPPRSSAIVRAAVSVVAALLAGSAVGADAPKAVKPAVAAASGGKIMTRAELRDCMTREGAMKADDGELVREQAAVQTDKDALARDGDEMKERLAAVDRTKPESVAAYNDAVEARNRRVEAFQARATAFNARVEANEQLHAAYAQSCSNRRYLDEDAAALRKGR